MKLGIDVSQYQKHIDWKKVKNAGCDFAILRCVRGNNKEDTLLWDNIKGCTENRIPAEFYVYTTAVNKNQLMEELKVVKEFIQKLRKKYFSLQVCIWWDVEDNVLRSAGRQNLTELILTAESELTGYRPGGFFGFLSSQVQFGLYTGMAFYNEGYFDADKIKCPLWIARYPNLGEYKFGIDKPPMNKFPSIKTGYPISTWQYSSNGNIDGIEGRVDLNWRKK